MKIYKATCELFKRIKVAEKYTKEETLIKLQSGQAPTVPVMSGNKREENPNGLPTPRRAALESGRHKIQAV